VNPVKGIMGNKGAWLSGSVCTLCMAMWACGSTGSGKKIELRPLPEASRVEVYMGGKLFTAYRYDGELKKPVLYPVIAPGGETVSRGYPLDPRPGERVDHPHHSGIWFNYGAVNGHDFWNNSTAVPGRTGEGYGRIRHREILTAEARGDSAILEVVAEWQAPDTPSSRVILKEETVFVFRETGGVRIIDRVTRLTAMTDSVVWEDSKEGMLGIRTARAFELPSEKPVLLTGPDGQPVDSEVISSEGVSGWYRNSQGLEGHEVWGKRAGWVMLSATLNGKGHSLAIIDHPDNLNHPPCWHARDYGLFAVNNLGRNSYEESLEPFRHVMKQGDVLELKHRILVSGISLTDQEIRQVAAGFTGS